MNIRKFFYFPTKQQTMSLSTDVENVLTNCESIARKERDELRESEKSHNEICPNCRTRKGDSNEIVNKIRQVEGHGRVSGDFFLGFGSVDGSSSIKTHAVNHCNKCGNEWEKFKSKSVSRTDIVRVCLNYLADILKDPNEKNRSWKVEAIQVFDDCYAETIYHLSRKEYDRLWLSTTKQLTLKRLRKYYKSVFDSKPQKLEKI